MDFQRPPARAVRSRRGGKAPGCADRAANWTWLPVASYVHVPTMRRWLGKPRLKMDAHEGASSRVHASPCHALKRRQIALRPTAGRQPLTRNARVGPSSRDAKAGLIVRSAVPCSFAADTQPISSRTARIVRLAPNAVNARLSPTASRALPPASLASPTPRAPA